MNRYLVLIFLLLLATLSHFFIDSQSQIKINYESNTLLDKPSLNDSYPIDDDKYRLIYFSTLISLVLTPFNFTKTSTFLINLIKRNILLTPIFYQSNYVIIPPLSKKITFLI
jgi:hypothetical protein